MMCHFCAESGPFATNKSFSEKQYNFMFFGPSHCAKLKKKTLEADLEL